ncbi:hypothetical protein ACS0TY_024168 [Phlomoides rotata]
MPSPISIYQQRRLSSDGDGRRHEADIHLHLRGQHCKVELLQPPPPRIRALPRPLPPQFPRPRPPCLRRDLRRFSGGTGEDGRIGRHKQGTLRKATDRDRVGREGKGFGSGGVLQAPDLCREDVVQEQRGVYV